MSLSHNTNGLVNGIVEGELLFETASSFNNHQGKDISISEREDRLLFI